MIYFIQFYMWFYRAILLARCCRLSIVRHEESDCGEGLKFYKSTSWTKDWTILNELDSPFISLPAIRDWSDQRVHYHAPISHLHDRLGVVVLDQSFIYYSHRASMSSRDDICMPNPAARSSRTHCWQRMAVTSAALLSCRLHNCTNMLILAIPSNPWPQPNSNLNLKNHVWNLKLPFEVMAAS